MGTVLACDDCEITCVIVKQILSAIGLNVISMSDSEKALEQAMNMQNNPPCLFVLDCNMPKLNGLELARRIRATPGIKDVPILFVSSEKIDEYPSLKKPIMSSEFYWKVKELLR